MPVRRIQQGRPAALGLRASMFYRILAEGARGKDGGSSDLVRLGAKELSIGDAELRSLLLARGAAAAVGGRLVTRLPGFSSPYGGDLRLDAGQSMFRGRSADVEELPVLGTRA